MALLHQAQLRPSKIDLAAEWAPAQPWFEGNADAGFVSIASFRFDDPEGEVGIETLLIRAGDGPVLQMPLTYRGAPLAGAEPYLISTMHHSVLGERWVYDATGDPAYLAAIATAILTGGSQAEQYVDVDGELVRREPTAIVIGSGAERGLVVAAGDAAPTLVRHEQGATIVEIGLEASDLRLTVARVLHDRGAHDPGALADAHDPAARAALTGTWIGQPEPRMLAQAILR